MSTMADPTAPNVDELSTAWRAYELNMAWQVSRDHSEDCCCRDCVMVRRELARLRRRDQWRHHNGRSTEPTLTELRLAFQVYLIHKARFADCDCKDCAIAVRELAADREPPTVDTVSPYVVVGPDGTMRRAQPGVEENTWEFAGLTADTTYKLRGNMEAQTKPRPPLEELWQSIAHELTQLTGFNWAVADNGGGCRCLRAQFGGWTVRVTDYQEADLGVPEPDEESELGLSIGFSLPDAAWTGKTESLLHTRSRVTVVEDVSFIVSDFLRGNKYPEGRVWER